MLMVPPVPPALLIATPLVLVVDPAIARLVPLTVVVPVVCDSTSNVTPADAVIAVLTVIVLAAIAVSVPPAAAAALAAFDSVSIVMSWSNVMARLFK
jgi:hypothetical protein